MSLLGKKVETKSLAERTSDALGVFRTTMDQLVDINDEAGLSIEVNQEQINALEVENASYRALIESNSKVVNNIQKILK